MVAWADVYDGVTGDGVQRAGDRNGAEDGVIPQVIAKMVSQVIGFYRPAVGMVLGMTLSPGPAAEMVLQEIVFCRRAAGLALWLELFRGPVAEMELEENVASRADGQAGVADGIVPRAAG